MTNNLETTDTSELYENAKKSQSSLVRRLVASWEEECGEEIADMTCDPLCDVAKWYLGDAVSYLRANALGPVVTEEMVANLKEGTLIIDVCIDQGGCFETSEMTNLKKPTFTK